jgi:hypothetical protein
MMITQILAVAGVYTMVYFLLRLRHIILACGKDKRKYCRAYIVGFDETDWDSDQDGDSNNESDSNGAAKAHAAEGASLVEWPLELDLQYCGNSRIVGANRPEQPIKPLGENDWKRTKGIARCAFTDYL